MAYRAGRHDWTRGRGGHDAPRPARAPAPAERRWARVSADGGRAPRVRLLSWNVLADSLAREHARELYPHVARHVLAWDATRPRGGGGGGGGGGGAPGRGRRVAAHIAALSPEIACLQEVDRFAELGAALRARGLGGARFLRRTGGDARDGCALFWDERRCRLEAYVEVRCAASGLRHNVAQLAVFEVRGAGGRNARKTPIPRHLEKLRARGARAVSCCAAERGPSVASRFAPRRSAYRRRRGVGSRGRRAAAGAEKRAPARHQHAPAVQPETRRASPPLSRAAAPRRARPP